MAYKYSGRIIRAGKSWRDNDGIQHPSSWMRWSEETKAAKGLIWEDDPAPYDSQFFYAAGAPRPLDDVNLVDEDNNPVLDEDGQQVVRLGLKSNAIAKVKAQAGDKLAATDWMVIKASEVADYSLPTEVAVARAAIRTASNSIEAAILATSDLDQFMALYDVPMVDDMPTGNAPINDWPDEM